MKNLKFQGVKNIRDFGGLINNEGKQIRSGLFLRSACLDNLTLDDIHDFQMNYHLSDIIDLRMDQEVDERPDRLIMGTCNHHFSLLKSATAGISHQKAQEDFLEEAAEVAQIRYRGSELPSQNREIPDMPDMKGLYRNMGLSDHTAAMLREVFACIMQSVDEEGALLWHCTEGKDRCGIVSALFLYILDCDQELIMEDYLYTNHSARMKAMKYYLGALLATQDKKKADCIRDTYLAKQEYLDSYFAALEEKYGSTDNFICEILQITPEKKASLKAYCLEEIPDTTQ